ncbi:hypothetical protein C5167_038028 [Papaver somniferum]|uniref:Uncharacterized protein n=1 Tax=Papaver somniferum TaxID=3469 RepID=A0A4Y7IAK3_PAPSO|nr:hypothetical protein C5167_038028 [Papaver somniferum]
MPKKNWSGLTGTGSNRKMEISCSTTTTANKGHFVVYTTDQNRFVVPLQYLGSQPFQELLKMAEDEFGLACNGPLRLPCEAQHMEYVLSLLEKSTR